MKRRISSFIALLFLFVCVSAQSGPDIMERINRSYYFLPENGASGFTSTFQDESILKFAGRLADRNDSGGQALAQELSNFHLKVSVSSHDGFRMFTTPVPQINDDFVASGISDAVYKSERSLAAILDTWMQFVLHPVLPLTNEAGEAIRYEITENKLQWRIEQEDQGIQTSLVVDKSDYRVVKITSFSESGKVVIFPKFEATPAGWLFLGYDSIANEGRAKLKVRINHKRQGRIFIPEDVSLDVEFNQKPIGREHYQLNSEAILNPAERSR